MFRYVTLSWNPDDAGRTTEARMLAARIRASSSEWATAFECPGLICLHADARPGANTAYALDHNRGVVLGKLFNRISDAAEIASPLHFIQTSAADAIVRSEGRYLLTQFWGRYVAFVRNDAGDTVWVIRDPVGALPCFGTTFHDIRLIFSMLSDCECLNLPLSLNWRYVAAHVCFPGLVQAAETGIREIRELQPGECWELRSGLVQRQTLYWRPAELARSGLLEDARQATKALRTTVRACVTSWASAYPRILHLLSGGLDSSIVLSCLKRGTRAHAITCLTYFNTSSPAADERLYARLVAQKFECELIEVEERPDEGNLDVILGIPRSPNPWPMQYYATHSASEHVVARWVGASAFFYGVGGDQLFYQNPMHLTAADFVYYHGIRPSAMRLIAQVASAQGLSFWAVLRHAVTCGLLRRKWGPLKAIGSFRMHTATSDAISSVRDSSYLEHPWLRDAAGLPWGKLEHIRMLSVSHDFYDPLAPKDAPERVRPLVSQPLIELCLRTPTYVLGARGCDRAIARAAFADELPREIAWRRTKGVIDSYYQQLLRSNFTFVRELMLDGLLVREGLLDRSKLEQVFAGLRSALGPEVNEIIAFHLGTEVWLRRWTEARTQVAA